MRSRLCSLLVVVLSLGTSSLVRGQDTGDPRAGGLVGGDYLRIAGGGMSFLNASGSLREWTGGPVASLMWENWQPDAGVVGKIGFGIGVDYGRLPLDKAQFLNDFQAGSGQVVTSPTGGSAQILSIATNIRIRIPSPLISPSLSLGLGFLDVRPKAVDYFSNGVAGSVKQQPRSGAEFSFSGAIDRQLFGRFALYGEAQWMYGLTSLGRVNTPSGVCAQKACEGTKNTTIGTIRGGLRVRTNR
jgi:hypothetical protein